MLVVVVVLGGLAGTLKFLELEIGLAPSTMLSGIILRKVGVLNEDLLIGLAPHLPGAISVTITQPQLERNFNCMSTIFPFGLYVLARLCCSCCRVVVVVVVECCLVRLERLGLGLVCTLCGSVCAAPRTWRRESCCDTPREVGCRCLW